MAEYTFSDFYKCGAQVQVLVNGFPLLECAGIGFSIHESKLPIYGYSSRHFDAVGRGRVLVEGSLFVNWIHEDYMTQAINLANSSGRFGSYTTPAFSVSPSWGAQQGNTFASEQDLNDFVEHAFYSLSTGENNIDQVADALENAFDGYQGNGYTTREYARTYNPHDMVSPVTLRITAGQRTSRLPNGDFGLDLTQVHFTGRSKKIQVSEEVILEQHTFFARNALTLAYTDINPNQGGGTKPAQPVAQSTPSTEIRTTNEEGLPVMENRIPVSLEEWDALSPEEQASRRYAIQL